MDEKSAVSIDEEIGSFEAKLVASSDEEGDDDVSAIWD